MSPSPRDSDRHAEPSVSVSTVFADLPPTAAVAAAAKLGFSSLELWWPAAGGRDILPGAVADAGATVSLLSLDAGDTELGERGMLADPERSSRLWSSFDEALELAERLSCTRLYTLVGNHRAELDRERERAVVAERLARMADLALDRRIELLIEPVNAVDNGPQVLAGLEEATELLGELRRANLGLLADVYHVRHAEPDVAAALGRVLPDVRHVHLSDFPGRVEPGRGTLDFAALAELLRSDRYAGTIGFEWFPIAAPAEGLAAGAAAGFASARSGVS